MKKIKLLLSLIKKFFVSPVLLLKHNMHFLIDAEKKNEVEEAGFKNGLPTIDIIDLIGTFEVTLKNFTFLDGTSRLSDLALLKLLAKQYENCDYLEIGSWRGESIVNVAENAAACYSLSLSQKEMSEMNFDEGFIKMDGLFLKDMPNIKTFRHNSKTFDFNQLNKKFDLIFIDGDHAYDAVLSDTKNVFKLLKNEKSIIVWHDCGNTYEDMRWEVIAAIIKGTPAEKRKYLYRVSNSLCGIYIAKEMKKQFPKFPSSPSKLFEVTIKTKAISGN